MTHDVLTASGRLALRVAGVAWLAAALVLAFMLAFAIPSILTPFGLAAIFLAGSLLFRPNRRMATLSTIAAVAFIGLAISYTAGPTSGFQSVNPVSLQHPLLLAPLPSL